MALGLGACEVTMSMTNVKPLIYCFSGSPFVWRALIALDENLEELRPARRENLWGDVTRCEIRYDSNVVGSNPAPA
jgi:hypothetical protein